MNAHDGLAAIFTRNAFYKKMHFLALSALLLLCVVVGILIWTLVYLIKHPTHPLYFATDSVGRLIDVIPLDTPNMPEEGIIEWAVEGVQKALSYDFVNYRAQLQSTQKYFTSYGWQNYMRAIQANNNFKYQMQQKWILIAQVVDQPKVTRRGILAGAYAWRLEMPVLVTFWKPPFTNKSKFVNALNVSVIAQRQEILQSYKGLGIVQIITASAVTTNPLQEISNTSTS